MEDKNNIETLRKKLHMNILQYGRDSPESLKVSQELDKLIVREMKRRVNKDKKIEYD